jgi:hypothetical protein
VIGLAQAVNSGLICSEKSRNILPEGKRMARIKITIQDDGEKVIGETAEKEYQVDLGKATLAEIEGAVEDFKKRALADIEKELLMAAQARFVEEQKKEKGSSVMGQRQ